MGSKSAGATQKGINTKQIQEFQFPLPPLPPPPKIRKHSGAGRATEKQTKRK